MMSPYVWNVCMIRMYDDSVFVLDAITDAFLAGSGVSNRADLEKIYTADSSVSLAFYLVNSCCRGCPSELALRYPLSALHITNTIADTLWFDILFYSLPRWEDEILSMCEWVVTIQYIAKEWICIRFVSITCDNLMRLALTLRGTLSDEFIPIGHYAPAHDPVCHLPLALQYLRKLSLRYAHPILKFERASWFWLVSLASMPLNQLDECVALTTYAHTAPIWMPCAAPKVSPWSIQAMLDQVRNVVHLFCALSLVPRWFWKPNELLTTKGVRDCLHGASIIFLGQIDVVHKRPPCVWNRFFCFHFYHCTCWVKSMISVTVHKNTV